MHKYVKVADGMHQECHIKYRTIVQIVLTARDVVRRNPQKSWYFPNVK